VVDLWLETKKQKKQKKHFHRFNGFLSLQLNLRLELGFGLRLTNNRKVFWCHTYSLRLNYEWKRI
jgi:hypothetical protein